MKDTYAEPIDTFSYHLAYEFINERLSEQALTATNITKLANCIHMIEADQHC